MGEWPVDHAVFRFRFATELLLGRPRAGRGVETTSAMSRYCLYLPYRRAVRKFLDTVAAVIPSARAMLAAVAQGRPVAGSRTASYLE